MDNPPKIEQIDPKTLFKKDSNGYLLPEGKESNIISPWKEVVGKVKNVYLDTYGDEIVSIYVSGSVARGVPGKLSDLDTFAILKRDVSEEENSNFSKKVYQELDPNKNTLPKLDSRLLPLSSIIGDNADFRDQFILKLLSAPVYGEDLAHKLPNFKADKDTAKKLMGNSNKSIQRAKEIFQNTDDPSRIKNICRWIMKKFMKNCFYPIMAKEEVYTNSPETALILFSKYFPEKTQVMKQVYDLCNEPSASKEEIIKVIDEISPWLNDQVEKLRKSD